ncbi:MAG: phosphotransferase [candidate division Zixibacteria bacterium]
MGIVSNFKAATDIDRMKSRFQKEIDRFLGKEGELKYLYIPRAFPRNDGGFSISYNLIIDKTEKGEEKIILWGHLLGLDQTLPGKTLAPRQDLIIFDDIGLVVPVFPYDPKLKYLPDFVVTGKPKKRLGAIPFLAGKKFDVIECRLLGYRLERRCVFEYTLDMKQNDGIERIKVVAKIARPKKIAAALKIFEKFSATEMTADSSDGLTVPEYLGCDNDHGIILMEFVSGRSLHSLIGNRSFPESCHEAGRLIRKLHSISLGDLPYYTADDELDSLSKIVDIINSVFPELGEAFGDAYSGITRGRIGDDYAVGPVHRDFYDKQTLHSPGRATLLDFDNMALSDPALDYGNFMAHLDLRRYQSPENEMMIIDGSEAFVSGYESAGKEFTKRVNWWRAAALLRLAGLYSLRPRWKSIAKNLLLEINSSQEGKNILSGEKR